MAYQGKRAITPEKKKKEKVIKQPTNEQSIVVDNDVVDISSILAKTLSFEQLINAKSSALLNIS